MATGVLLGSYMRCAAYCTATSFENSRLVEYLKSRYGATRIREVIHVKLGQTTHATAEGDVFFFPYASVVFWGLERSQEKSLLNEIKQFEYQPVEEIGEDEFVYTYGPTTSIKEDDIVLPDKEILTKVAFSHAIAQSVKLDTFEYTIQKTVDLTRELPRRLAEQGKISLSGKEIRRMMGTLFIDRHSINLHQELLDTPEFFWEYSELEPIYKIVAHYLDIERRVNVLNQRLTVLKELFDMLNNEINHKHSNRLEWTIIWLIVIEVFIALSKDIFKLF
jgi:uncharacterized Rmd1/YagE family protein